MFDARQFILVDSDYFFENARETTSEIARLLGLNYIDDAADVISGKITKFTNVNHLKPPPHMTEASMAMLRNFFEPMRDDLANLLRTYVHEDGVAFVGDLGRFTEWRRREKGK